jgi:D-inositol-3-phosphate glycosyltransferase
MRVTQTEFAKDNSLPSLLTDRQIGGSPAQPIAIEASLITGGFDRPYAFGLATALASNFVRLDVIGSDEVDSPELHSNPNLRFLNFLRNRRSNVGVIGKASRVFVYYALLIGYAIIAKPKIFHILWNGKFEYFDRTVLMLYYKLLGKKIVFTAHNVNAGKRDLNDSPLNRVTLKIQYLLSDHIFVHTDPMKQELIRDFGVNGAAVSVIPFGINNSVPSTSLTSAEAKRQLHIGDGEKTILFFGAIRPYKGLAFLIEAYRHLVVLDPQYRLIIAGEPKRGAEDYIKGIQDQLRDDPALQRVIARIHYIEDRETELYFKAADVLALPYTHIFQSGVLFLSYGFGLPVVASDVGSFREDIVEERTGFLCKPCDAIDLAAKLRKYFASELFQSLEQRRSEIQAYAQERNSWNIVGETTRIIYSKLVER